MSRSKLPFRSSSVKAMGSSLFSRNRRDDAQKDMMKPSGEPRRRRASISVDERRPSELQRPPLTKDSRPHRDDFDKSVVNRRELQVVTTIANPDRRLGVDIRPRKSRGITTCRSLPFPRDRNEAIVTIVSGAIDRDNMDRPSRLARFQFLRTSLNGAPLQGRPGKRPDDIRPQHGYNANSHPTPQHNSAQPPNPPLRRTRHERKGSDSFFSKFPTSFATYAGIRALSEHADKAKEWVEWFNNVNDAPDEIRALTSRISTTRDTVQQMKECIEARPDLIEDETGQVLKSHIEEAIDSTSETLKKMTKLLAGFSGAAKQDGTALGRLEGFWHSYNYKHEGEEQIKAADAELQQQLLQLGTLMSNIYAEHFEPPINPPKAATNPPTPPHSEPSVEQQQPPSHASTNAPPAGPDESSTLPSPKDILLDAAWEGDVRTVANCMRQAPPNSCDPHGLTPLHLAVERDHMAVAMYLLDHGADVHARADGGCMPLHLAARYASAATVEMLIERGKADPNCQTTDGRTPLHYAARSAEDGDAERREVIRALRDLGANPTLRNRRGELPRDVAQKRDFWDAAATLSRAELKWEQQQQQRLREQQLQLQRQQQLQQREQREQQNRQNLSKDTNVREKGAKKEGSWLQRYGLRK
ncbi:hypothetical protein MKX07_006584 [Trichoderma sp. CBMAI-0711]|nr:hypothetical protein MKX07_006584 [Trichoderma sp. CBMAI-0711]